MPITRVGDINMEYYVEGAGPPLIMIMGFGWSGNAWGEPVRQRAIPGGTAA